MSTGWVLAAAGVACAGAVAVPSLTAVGLGHLAVRRAPRRLLAVAAAAGILAGAGAGLAAYRAGSLWWLPALSVWALVLAAAAVCDAHTQRVPTPLVWAGAAATGVLLVPAAAVTGDWRALTLSAVAAGSAGVILLLCWRFLGAGFGDVRLAVLGGLGLGHTRYSALFLAVLVFALLSAALAGIAYARTRDRHAMIPQIPALAVAFLIAAAA